MEPGTLRLTLALAGAFKEGDHALVGAADDRVREDARRALLATTVGDIHATALINDRVSELLQRSRDRRLDAEFRLLTIGRVREALLGPGADAWARAYGPALGSEAIAAVAKVLTDDELSSVSRALFHPLGNVRGDHNDRVAIGDRRHLGSRIQPNSAGDDEHQILFSIFEGLAYGCGDVILGLNPAADDLGTIVASNSSSSRWSAASSCPRVSVSCRISSSSTPLAGAPASTWDSKASPARRGRSSGC
jgi:ethanolamine ammonia-lyase large subunit